MITFLEYVEKLNLTIDQIRSMIMQALGGNTDSKEVWNAPLVQFAEPGNLLEKLYSLNNLQQLISNNPAAIEAINQAGKTKLTVGQLVGILNVKS